MLRFGGMILGEETESLCKLDKVGKVVVECA